MYLLAAKADTSIFSSVLAWLPTLIGIVIFLGAAAVYLKGSKDKGTIETLSKNNEALTERVLILERSESELKVKVEALEVKNTVLEGVATSAEAIGNLHRALDEHNEKALTALALIHSDLIGRTPND
jgi:hypothetical protein